MSTKLLLIEDVENLGRSGEVVSVKPGYARNLLLPSKKALLADRRTLKLQAQLQEKRTQQAIVDKQDADALAERVGGQTVTSVVKVDHAGHMYGSVSTTDILHLLEKQHAIVVEKKAILLKMPIKETGVYDILLKLKEGVTATFHLKVISEAAALEAQQENPE